MVKFIKEAYQELRKVQWPNKRDVIRLTAYVIGVSFLVGLLITGLDYVFSEMLSVYLG